MEHAQRPCPLQVGVRAAQPLLGGFLAPDQPGFGQDMLQVNQQGAAAIPGRSCPFTHRVGWEALTPMSFASCAPPNASTRIRTRLAAKGSSAAVDRAPGRPVAVTFVVVVFVWVLVIEP